MLPSVPAFRAYTIRHPAGAHTQRVPALHFDVLHLTAAVQVFDRNRIVGREMPIGFAALVAYHVEQYASGDKRLVEFANIVLGRPAVGGDGAGRYVVVILAVIAHVGQAVPLGRALQIHGNIVVVGNG